MWNTQKRGVIQKADKENFAALELLVYEGHKVRDDALYLNT